MSRSRLIFYAVLGLGLLIVGAQAVFAATENTGLAASEPTATATVPPDRSWTIAGTIQAMNGEFWTVQGFAIRVTADTQITGDLPTIGSYVSATGTVESDGTWLATHLQVGSDTPTATPTTAPTETSTPVPTATPIPAATATPTATPVTSVAIIFHVPAAIGHASAHSDRDDARASDHDAASAHPSQGHQRKGNDSRNQRDRDDRPGKPGQN